VEKTDMIRARVEPKLKSDAETILESLGLTASDAIRVFYKQIVLRKGLPFDLLIPNAETRKALAEYKKNPRGTRYKDAKVMRKKLGI
jgi:DNA-damage-inducible protein J